MSDEDDKALWGWATWFISAAVIGAIIGFTNYDSCDETCQRMKRIDEDARERYMKRYECENFGEMYFYDFK